MTSRPTSTVYPQYFDISKHELVQIIEEKSFSESMTLTELMNKLRVYLATGLNDNDLIQRQQVFGKNVLPPIISKTLIRRIWDALHDKTLMLLSAVAFIALAIGIYQDFGPDNHGSKSHWIEGVAIIIAVVIVSMVGSINDFQKEKQFQKLNAKKENRNIKVLRNGSPKQIPAHDLLVGDIVLLEPGDFITADGILMDAMNLKMDESSITGESDAVKKSLQKDCYLISGSKVLEGVGRYLVCAVGEASFFGKTMMALRVEEESTPLQEKLDFLAGKIAKIGTSIAVLMLVVLIIKYVVIMATTGGFTKQTGAQIAQTVINIFISAITIVVVAVPEGLPLAVTLALAYGMTKMMEENNLVRVLSACETMGGATTICSDKTGTLTMNRMTVVNGVIGRYYKFASDKDIAVIRNQLVFSTIQDMKVTDLIFQGVAINSSAFEEVDPNSKDKKSKRFVGSKTEVALLEWLSKMNVDYVQLRKPSLFEIVHIFPFSSEKKYMATLIKVKSSSNEFYRIFIKGAPEIILKYCTQYLDLNSLDLARLAPMDEPALADFTGMITSFADDALRTLGMGYRDMTIQEFNRLIEGLSPKIQASLAKEKISSTFEHPITETLGVKIMQDTLPTYPSSEPPAQLTLSDVLSHPLAAAEFVECKLTFLTLFGIQDPIRPGVPEAVTNCQKAGVFVRMVTGDNVLTATSIAAKCGILTRGGIVMDGAKFRKLSPEEMDQVIPRLQVLARSTPTDKQLLVSRLKALKETVAVTGDGTNDAPALKAADIGFSMGIAGTEVAKEASSIILMDDNFSSIVVAIMWGRTVNDAVKKFLMFQLTVNLTAVTTSFISAALDASESSMLTAIQLLWVNLIMDSLAALALATDPPHPTCLERPPEDRSKPLITRFMWKMIIGQSILQITVALLLMFLGPRLFGLTNLEAAGGFMNADTSDPLIDQEKTLLRTIVFNTFIFFQIFNQINCRSLNHHLNVFMGMSKNFIFISIILIVVGIQVIIIYFGDVAFSTTRLNGTQWLATVLIGFISLPWGMFIRLMPIETLFGVPDQTIHLSLPPEVADIHPLHKSMSQNNDFSWFAAVRGSKGRSKTDVRTLLP